VSEARARGAFLLGLVLLAAKGAAPQDAYPSDITPPAGTQYPCALTALPRGLPGIPEADREYINRTYARILRATQAKLVLLKALEERRDLDARLARACSRRSSRRPCRSARGAAAWTRPTGSPRGARRRPG
jgi:hypothetical protein